MYDRIQNAGYLDPEHWPCSATPYDNRYSGTMIKDPIRPLGPKKTWQNMLGLALAGLLSP